MMREAADAARVPTWLPWPGHAAFSQAAGQLTKQQLVSLLDAITRPQQDQPASGCEGLGRG